MFKLKGELISTNEKCSILSFYGQVACPGNITETRADKVIYHLASLISFFHSELLQISYSSLIQVFVPPVFHVVFKHKSDLFETKLELNLPEACQKMVCNLKNTTVQGFFISKKRIFH